VGGPLTLEGFEGSVEVVFGEGVVELEVKANRSGKVVDREDF